MTGSPPGAHLRLACTEGSLCKRGCAQQCCAQLAVPAQGRGENCKSGEVKSTWNSSHIGLQVMSGVKGKGGPLVKSRSGSKLREQKSVSGLVTVEEEGKENLGPEVVSSFGGKVEKDGVVEEREVEREEWKGEVRLSINFCARS